MLVKSIWKVLVSSIAVFVLTSMMATAAPIFSDNFDDDALSLNQTVFGVVGQLVVVVSM